MRNPPTGRPRWRGLAVAATLGALPAIAAADAGDVFNYSLGSSVTRDANLFRLAPGVDPLTAIGSSDAADTLTTMSFGLNADKQIGIQRLKLNMQLGNTRYQQFRRLDNDSYNLSGTWAWALGHRLRGDISTARKTALSGFDEIATATRNITTTTTQSASAYLQVIPDWEVFGIVGSNDSANSAANNQAASFASRSTDAGLRYSARAGHQLSLLKRQVRSAQVRQDTIDASATWVYSGLTQLSGGLGSVRRVTEGNAASDSGGATGNLRVGWSYSPKTQFSFGASREVSAAASNFATSTVVRGVQLGATWAPTAMTSVQLSLDQSQTRYGTDPTTAVSREDTRRNLGLTLSWRPHRSLSLGLSLRHEARDSNLAAFVYRDRLATASAEFAF